MMNPFQLPKLLLLLPLTLVFVVVSGVNGANILFFNLFASHSHLVAFLPLANKLADKGHNVSILSPMVSKDTHPKIHNFCPDSVTAKQDALNIIGEYVVKARLESKFNDFFMQTPDIWDSSVDICRILYADPHFLQWRESTSFDLMVIDAFQRECSMPLAKLWGAKVILFNPATIWYAEQDSFGYGTEASSNVPFETQSDLWWKTDSLIYEWRSLSWYLWRQWSYLPAYDRLIQEQLNRTTVNGVQVKVPRVTEMEKEVALYFVNQHFAADLPRTLPPFVVPVGGMHCREAKAIDDDDIKKFIEDPKSDGFIFISFGSISKISALPLEKLTIFLDTFASFPRIKFLWKWEDDFPQGINNIPKNIFFSKWFPQQDVLGHPKCKGFISQGGMMSFQQSIFHGVPLIIFPGGGDQVYNARQIARRVIGVHLELSELTLQKFQGAVQGLLKDAKYSKNVKSASNLFKDRPMTAVDTGVYWTEYVLRHSHEELALLKATGFHQSWWERRMLHYWALIFLAIFTLLVLLSYLFCAILSRLLIFGFAKTPTGNRGAVGSKKNE